MEPQIAARVLAAVPVIVVLAVAGLDIFFEAVHWPSISQRLQTWTGEHPLLAAGLVVVLGALIGHFLFWKV